MDDPSQVKAAEVNKHKFVHTSCEVKYPLSFSFKNESGLKLLSYGQLSPGAVVTWAFVFLIRANFVAS